jgi:hypothetical protein
MQPASIQTRVVPMEKELILCGKKLRPLVKANMTQRLLPVLLNTSGITPRAQDEKGRREKSIMNPRAQDRS